MKAQFTKGQKVVFIKMWADALSQTKSAVTFKVTPALVHSCGAKRMILSDLEGNIFQGMNFAPRVHQMNSDEVIAFTTLEAAIARAQEIAVAYRLAQIENMKIRIERAESTRIAELMQETLDHLLANEAKVIL